MRHQLPLLCRREGVCVVVVDSVAALFRGEEMEWQRRAGVGSVLIACADFSP